MCPAASQWRTSSEAAPLCCPIIAGAPHETGEVEGVLLHTPKHGVKYILSSGGVTQRDKLEELLKHLSLSPSGGAR